MAAHDFPLDMLSSQDVLTPYATKRWALFPPLNLQALGAEQKGCSVISGAGHEAALPGSPGMLVAGTLAT